MPRFVTRKELIAAFAGKPQVAEKLARAIDGIDGNRVDGVLTAKEISIALTYAKTDGLAPELTKTFAELFGHDFATALPDAKAVQRQMYTEKAVNGITQIDLMGDLRPLTKDPQLSIRDATTPEYMKAAEYVAKQLAAAGVKPLGDGGTYFQAFRWEDRYRPGVINKSANVVGVLPGKGKEPREAVMVIAHLDNLSQAEKDDYEHHRGQPIPTYEGANDNTASVAAALEVARGLQEADNQRDVIFLIPSAEEEGLKGTEAYMMAPTVPLDRIIGAVNMEMIGRNVTSELLIYGGQNAQDAANNPLYERAMNIASRSETSVKPGHHNDDGEGWYRRSDHLVTANAGIPSIMFHGRTTRGNYHTSDDTLENLNLEKVEVTARQVLRVVRELANDPEPTEKRGPPKWQLNPFAGKVWPGE